jgi:hypothetical protein
VSLPIPEGLPRKTDRTLTSTSFGHRNKGARSQQLKSLPSDPEHGIEKASDVGEGPEQVINSQPEIESFNSSEPPAGKDNSYLSNPSWEQWKGKNHISKSSGSPNLMHQSQQSQSQASQFNYRYGHNNVGNLRNQRNQSHHGFFNRRHQGPPRQFQRYPYAPNDTQPLYNANHASASTHFTVDTDTLKICIQRQIEYYFSVENLCKDIYFRNHMDPITGWVDLSFIAQFNRVKVLTDKLDLISESLILSDILELSDDKSKIRLQVGWDRWTMTPAASNLASPESCSPTDDPVALVS